MGLSRDLSLFQRGLEQRIKEEFVVPMGLCLILSTDANKYYASFLIFNIHYCCLAGYSFLAEKHSTREHVSLWEKRHDPTIQFNAIQYPGILNDDGGKHSCSFQRHSKSYGTL